MSTKIATAFLERVQKSGLVSSEKLSQLLQEMETEGVDVDDPTALSKALVARDEISQWQADKLLQGKHKGFFLGSYRLERPLGKGGMGAVYLARHVVMRRRCAIKVLPQNQIQKHSSVLERFILESQAVAALDHQNIVRAYDIASEAKDNKEIHYLVMEYVEGQDVQQAVQEHGVFGYVKAAEIIRQTANGLAHAHESGLVHRDIKPANLLMDKKGTVKILDLGLARFFDDDEAASLTAAHNETVLGTADYLSPEQALNSHDVDLRTDIYSLGCTAYFLLTGHPPFPDGTVAQRLVAHQVKQPEPITNERPDAPPELLAIIDKMMAKKAEDRFQTCTEISAAISAWLVKYGGEDWRRQHSDITSNSEILKLLTKQHEPTRAMASPMSETELELAPLDDDEHEESAVSASDSGSGVGRAPDGSSTRSGDGLEMAEDDDDSAAGEAVADKSPALDEQEDAHAVGAIDELPTLDRTSTSDSSHDGLFGAIPLDEGLDSLADLEQAASVDTVDSSPGLGALESDIRKMPVRSPSSSTRQKKPESAKPKTLWESLTSVGLPIVVGVAGGGILGLIVLVVYLSTGGKEPDRTNVSTASPEIANVSPTDVDAEESKSRPAKKKRPVPDEGQPAEATEKDRPSDRPAKERPEATRAVVATDQEKPKVDQQQATSEDVVQRPETAGQPDEAVMENPVVDQSAESSAGQPDVVEPDQQAGTEGSQAESSADADAEATEKPVRPVRPPTPQVSRNQVFATITEFALDVEAETVGGGGGGRNKKAPSAEQLAVAFRPGIARALDYAVRNTDLKLVENSETAVMHVTIDFGVVDGFNVISLAASLDCRYRGSDPASVWDVPKTEVMRFMPQTNQRVLAQMWDDKSREFFRQFRTAYEDATQDANQ